VNGNDKTIRGLAYSAEKRQLFWLNTKKLSVQFWDFRTRRLESIDVPKSSSTSGVTTSGLTSLAVHNDKLYISSGGTLYRTNTELDDQNEMVIPVLHKSLKMVIPVHKSLKMSFLMYFANDK
jgi:hypothetical protein